MDHALTHAKSFGRMCHKRGILPEYDLLMSKFNAEAGDEDIFPL